MNASNKFDYKNNVINGNLDTIVDSTKFSSFKAMEEDIGSDKKLGVPNNNSNSRFSRLGGSTSPQKHETSLDTQGLVGRSLNLIKKNGGGPNTNSENQIKNRSSLSPTKKSNLGTNEIYKMAIMNQKKKNQGL